VTRVCIFRRRDTRVENAGRPRALERAEQERNMRLLQDGWRGACLPSLAFTSNHVTIALAKFVTFDFRSKR
jgi:hypothetical protein